MSDIYNDNTYLKHNPGWHEDDAGFKAGKILHLLYRNSFPFNSVAEVGCGSGEILVQLKSKLGNNHIQFNGYDISEAAIAIAKPKENEQIQFECKDFTYIKEDTHFDLLLVIDVIEHIEDYFSFLNNLLPKSTYTIFHIPLDICVWSLFRENMLIESKERVGHIHNFTEAFILSILKDKGYTIIDKIYTEPIIKKEAGFKQKLINNVRKILFNISPTFCSKTIGGYSIMLLAKNT